MKKTIKIALKYLCYVIAVCCFISADIALIDLIKAWCVSDYFGARGLALFLAPFLKKFLLSVIFLAMGFIMDSIQHMETIEEQVEFLFFKQRNTDIQKKQYEMIESIYKEMQKKSEGKNESD